MKTRNLASFVAAVALCGVAATAGAQTNGPKGISARIGVAIPTDTRYFGSAFAAGIDYKFPTIGVKSPGEGLQSYLGASVDYYGNGDGNNIPVALTYNVRSGSIVYNAGIGVDFYSADKNGTSLGGQVGISYEFGHGATLNNPLFVQAKYFITRESALNSFGLYVGYRF